MLKNKKKKFFSILAILFILIPNNSYASILTVFKPLGFIAAAIAHNVTNVEVIVPNETTVENDYLLPFDLIKIKHSDFIILIGDQIEPFFLKRQSITLKKNYCINQNKKHQISFKT